MLEATLKVAAMEREKIGCNKIPLLLLKTWFRNTEVFVKRCTDKLHVCFGFLKECSISGIQLELLEMKVCAFHFMHNKFWKASFFLTNKGRITLKVKL